MKTKKYGYASCEQNFIRMIAKSSSQRVLGTDVDFKIPDIDFIVVTPVYYWEDI